MPISIELSDDTIFEVLGDFIANVTNLPNEDVIQGQENRVAEPVDKDFVVMWSLRRERLSTNVDSNADCGFQGAIAGNVLTVDSVQLGVIGPATIGPFSPTFTLWGPDVAANTVITSQTSGTPGGPGVYTVTPSQTVSLQGMACGVKKALQGTRVVIQVDVHGPNSADNAQIISQLFRDSYAYEFMNGENALVSPLYADDPRQMPFSNAEQQVENRWVVEAAVQANVPISIPQQYATTFRVILKDVDVVYPP